MIIASIKLIHLAIPFATEFRHAKKTRQHGDTILVLVTTEVGAVGIGEILPRDYVSGESVAGIMSDTECPLLRSVVGREFTSQQSLHSWVLEQHESAEWGIAKLGGVELALWSVFSQLHPLDLDVLIGPVRQSSPGHCITIGFDAASNELRARAIHARLQKATVVKLKIGLDDDAVRLSALNIAFNGNMPIRLDANGTYEADALIDLLRECAAVPIHSVEQPFDASDEKLLEKLNRVHASTQVPMMADESVCSISDARHWIETGGYQFFNIRVGKHGGIVGSGNIRDAANGAGISLVGGSMVGESGILTLASQMLLDRSETLPYVEGLGQNESFLQLDPVIRLRHSGAGDFAFDYLSNDCEPFLVADFMLS